MPALRDEIRAILREEIAALRSEIFQSTETVVINTSADLNRFAQDILARADNSNFSDRLRCGEIIFALAETSETKTNQMPNPIVTSPPKPTGVTLNNDLVTEQDIVELGSTARVVRLPMQSRLTPLAKDEARRKGIRIERVEA